MQVSESLGQCWELLPDSSLPMAVLNTNDLYDGEFDEVYMEDVFQDQAWRYSTLKGEGHQATHHCRHSPK